jgi:hypothetical protein
MAAKLNRRINEFEAEHYMVFLQICIRTGNFFDMYGLIYFVAYSCTFNLVGDYGSVRFQ